MGFDREFWVHLPHAQVWALVCLSADIEPTQAERFVDFPSGRFVGFDAAVRNTLNQRLQISLARANELEGVRPAEPGRLDG